MEIIWGSIDGVGIKETDGDVDGTKDGEMEGAEEELGIKDGREEVDGTKDGVKEGEMDGFEDGEMEGREDAEGFMDGTDDNVGIKEGEAEGLMDGDEEEVGIEDTDGDVDGKCDRLGSQSISIFDGFIYVYYSVISRSSKSPQLTVKCFAGINSFGLPTGRFFGYDSKDISSP